MQRLHEKRFTFVACAVCLSFARFGFAKPQHVMHRMHAVCQARFCQVTAQCESVHCKVWCRCGAQRDAGKPCSLPRQVLPGHCTMFWCTVLQNARSLQARQVLPGHRAAALLQNFLPLVCHLASAFCSNVHFQTIFSQISISSAHFPIHKILLQQQPSMVKCFNKQA